MPRNTKFNTLPELSTISLEQYDAYQADAKEVANRVSKLRSSVLKVVNNRERIPNILFWSLFHTELAGIRKKKSALRETRRLLFDIDS